ncbi:C39 family peptidase [Telmatospirillum sp. J64-1]|uniref:C39 family peptidase n=1 Tax=Telmatospirillum sp. J64-1 TaxID=2502183 RepID=UPI00115C9D3B|nr:C39 family peptidase [Telmatospirillum sp. J64-1]
MPRKTPLSHKTPLIAAALAVCLYGGSAVSAAAGEVRAHVAGASFSMPVISMKEARFKRVVQQEYDFSCGSAAIATLLTYHYGRPTPEKEVFKAMWENGDQQAIRKHGFSLLDMKAYLATHGLRSDGFRVPLDKLIEVGVPAVTLIDTKGYRHFVVIKGIRDGRILIGDPALGVKTMGREDFEKIWSGVLFVIRDETPVGQASFNQVEEWGLQPSSPLETGFQRRGLGSATLPLHHLTLPLRSGSIGGF